MNALTDEATINALYDASQAGVKIDLIVRGACALRPGVKGLSDNIRVRSIVGRFLEHHRIYYFRNGGAPKVYLSSADWMGRNLFRRIEIAWPVLDPKLRKRVVDEGSDAVSRGHAGRMGTAAGRGRIAHQSSAHAGAQRSTNCLAMLAASVGET